ncbi:MAG TPA: glutamate--cysteine ligase [Pseudonocardiaceae bacterium]
MGTAPTIGVEEEFLLVDDRGNLALVGPEVTERPRRAEGELQHELARCMVESATAVCTTAEQALVALTELRTALAARAAPHGARLLPSGTPVMPEEYQPGLTPDPRYERMSAHFGALAHTANTCGQHVHVAVPDRDAGVRVINHLRPWLPLLLALSANSPFHFGQDTGHASWRHLMQARWPSAGAPPLFASLDHYEASVAAMLRSGAMLDRAMVYWDVRLSEQHPTVEVRVGDVAPTPERAALLAALARALVARALDEPAPAPELPGEVLRAGLWRAARDGLSGASPDPRTGEVTPALGQLHRLVDDLAPELRAGDDADLVGSLLAGITGCGADLQRAAYSARGRPVDVVEALVTRS